jgi:hypothetical protein
LARQIDLFAVPVDAANEQPGHRWLDPSRPDAGHLRHVRADELALSHSIGGWPGKACPSLRVPDQRHWLQVVSPFWTDRQISA